MGDVGVAVNKVFDNAHDARVGQSIAHNVQDLWGGVKKPLADLGVANAFPWFFTHGTKLNLQRSKDVDSVKIDNWLKTTFLCH